MKLVFDLTHDLSEKALRVNFTMRDLSQTIDLSRPNNRMTFEYDYIGADNQTVDVVLSTDDLAIVKYPLQVESICLDDYYQRQAFKHLGQPQFSEIFLAYVKSQDFFIDQNCTTQRLNFVGNLTFTFKWPFWRNLYNDK